MSKQPTEYLQARYDELSPDAQSLVDIMQDLEGQPKPFRQAVAFLHAKHQTEAIQKFLDEMTKALKPLMDSMPKEENNGS